MSELPRSADCVVLGAGVMGTSIAFHLARRGAGRIALIERGDVASGGSGRSSALIRMHYSFPPEVDLAVKSLEIFRAWKDYVGGPGHYRRTGFVRIVPASEIDRLAKNVAMQRSRGVDTRVISRDELAEIEPDWSVEDVAAAAWEPGSGYGDGAGVATDFLERARELGVVYCPDTRVLEVRVEAGRSAGVATDRGDVAAPATVVALGPWTRCLLAPLGVDLPIEPERHQVAILKNRPGMKPSGSACIDSITTTYFRSELGGYTLVGDFFGRRGLDPDAPEPSPTADSLADLVARACRRIPALADSGIARGITGTYDMTPDSRPLLGELPEVAGLFVAAGFSGMGFKISPAVGLVLSELLLDGGARSVDVSAFAPDRFARGRPIKAEWEYGDEEPTAYT
jgi:sarcosine oxidase subunit beta